MGGAGHSGTAAVSSGGEGGWRGGHSWQCSVGHGECSGPLAAAVNWEPVVGALWEKGK